MGINRYFTPAQLPTGQDYFKLPFNELYTALGAKQKQQDEARAKNAELQAEADKVKALQPDQEEAFAINQKFKDSIDKLSNQDLTNPEGKMATRALIQMGREYFGPNGRATAINNNYNARALYEKKVDEYIKANKDVDPKYKEFAMNHFDEDYKHKGGIGQLNSNKSYNKYDTEDLAYVNVDAELEKAVTGIIADSIDISVENPDNKGYFLKKGSKHEWVKYDDVVAQATEKALSDPSIASHVGQGTKFGYYGQNDFDFKNAITTTKDAKGNIIRTPNNRVGFIFDRLGRKFGFDKTGSNQDYTSDATALYLDKKKTENAMPTLYGKTGVESKPSETGTTTQSNTEKLTGHINTLKSIVRDFGTTAVPYNSMTAEQKQLYTSGDFKGLLKSLESNPNISKELLNKYRQDYNNTVESIDIAKQKEAESENYAITKVGSDKKFKEQIDKLPTIDNLSKTQIMDAVAKYNTLGVTDAQGNRLKVGDAGFNEAVAARKEAIKLRDKNPTLFQQYNKIYQDNQKYLASKNKAKDEYFKGTPEQQTRSITYEWNIPGLDNDQTTALRKEAQNKFKAPENWANVRLMGNSDVNGKTLNELIESGKVDKNKIDEQLATSSTEVTLTNSPIKGNLHSGELAFRIGIVINGKPTEVFVPTDEISSPAIDAMKASPGFKVMNHYKAAQYEGLNKYENIKKYSESGQKVSFDFKNKYQPITINNKKYSEEAGLNILTLIQNAIEQGMSPEDITTHLKDIQ